jgi:hypothetical protein
MSSGDYGAGKSRLYGGIHAGTANLASQSIADELNILIDASWQISTA